MVMRLFELEHFIRLKIGSGIRIYHEKVIDVSPKDRRALDDWIIEKYLRIYAKEHFKEV